LRTLWHGVGVSSNPEARPTLGDASTALCKAGTVTRSRCGARPAARKTTPKTSAEMSIPALTLYP